MTYNKGSYISGDTEEEAADELRKAVHDALCRDQNRAKTFSEVDYSVEKFDGGKAKWVVPLFHPWNARQFVIIMTVK